MSTATMPTSDPLVFVRYLDVFVVVLAAPFVVLMGGPMLGYLVGAGVWISTATPRPAAPRRRSASRSAP